MKNNIITGLRVGVSATVLDRASENTPLDGIGIYTQSLFREYQDFDFCTQGYVFPPVKNHSLYYSFPSSFRSFALKGILPFNKSLKLPIDIFHVTDYMSIPMTCPVITTLYDAIPFIDPRMANSRLRALKNFILRRSAEYADHVIAISNYSVKELVEYYRISESKISVVYCGVEEDWITNQPTKERIEEVLKSYSLQRGYFLNVGTLQPRKNLERLIKAHNCLPVNKRKEHPLVVVGKYGWSCDLIVAQLKEKITCGEAYWLPNVGSREELKCLYAGSEAFIFPSLYEGFGLPVLEAFAVGVPVLTSNTTSLPEISKGIALEIDPLNINEMAEAIKYMLDLPDREERVTAGKKRAKELSWRHCGEETEKVYRKVLSGR